MTIKKTDVYYKLTQDPSNEGSTVYSLYVGETPKSLRFITRLDKEEIKTKLRQLNLEIRKNKVAWLRPSERVILDEYIEVKYAIGIFKKELSQETDASVVNNYKIALSKLEQALDIIVKAVPSEERALLKDICCDIKSVYQDFNKLPEAWKKEITKECSIRDADLGDTLKTAYDIVEIIDHSWENIIQKWRFL